MGSLEHIEYGYSSEGIWQKIYNMAMEFRGFVMERNLEKVNTSLQMVISMKDNSIMVILMEGGN